MTKRVDLSLSKRARHLACWILILLLGPGCEALAYAGLFDLAVEWLAQVLVRLSPLSARGQERRSRTGIYGGFRLIHSSYPGC